MNHIFLRQDKFYSDQLSTWKHIADAYSGGRKYIAKALIKHRAELGAEYEERIQRAYYINYPREIAGRITQFIFAVEPDRTNADPEVLDDFSRDGLSASEVMGQAATYITLYGKCWLQVDFPSATGEQITLADKKLKHIRPFCRALKPAQVPDWAYGDDGKLLWVVVIEEYTDKTNPFIPPITKLRRRLWTRQEWILFDSNNENPIASATHNLGIVPFVDLEEVQGFGMSTTTHWFEDVVRISDAILNNESEAQMNVIKQMFGLLVLPQALRDSIVNNIESNKEDGTATPEEINAILGRSVFVWEEAENKGITRYESPSGAETATIRSECQALKQELFEVVGLAMQSKSREAQTAESKAWDNHNVQQFLAFRAAMLEQGELCAWQIMEKWDSSIKAPEITYNREFSVIDLTSSVSALMELSSFNVGPEYSKQCARTAVSALEKVNKILPESKKKIYDEIENMEDLMPPEQNIPETNVDDIPKDNSKKKENEEK